MTRLTHRNDAGMSFTDAPKAPTEMTRPTSGVVPIVTASPELGRLPRVGQDLDPRPPVVVPAVALDDGQPVGSAQLKHPSPADPQDPGCFALGDPVGRPGL
jgi:hypothetical protein